MIWFDPSIERPTQNIKIKNAAEKSGQTVETIKVFDGCIGLGFDSGLSKPEQKDVAESLAAQLGGVWEITEKPNTQLDSQS